MTTVLEILQSKNVAKRIVKKPSRLFWALLIWDAIVAALLLVAFFVQAKGDSASNQPLWYFIGVAIIIAASFVLYSVGHTAASVSILLVVALPTAFIVLYYLSVLAALSIGIKDDKILKSLALTSASGCLILTVAFLVYRHRRRRQKEALLEQHLEAVESAEGSLVPTPEIPRELVDACLRSECVLYAGAGLSAQSGLPTWHELVRKMVDWAIAENIVDERTARHLRAALQVGQLESASEALLDSIGSRVEELQRFLQRTLMEGATPSALHELLARIPFAAALTTNFDSLLERSFIKYEPVVLTPRDTEKLLNAISSRAFFILKLYGDLRLAETVILSAAQYQDAITLNRAFSACMETLFFSRTLFFVGARLEGIEDYLAGIKFSQTRPRTHYALVDVGAAGPAWELKSNTMRKKYGIKVIPYEASEGHPEVVQFVDDLTAVVEERRQAASRLGQRGTSSARGALTRLVLDNIGPFEHLELDLNSGWTVLLGDNGVGKSNILKAIAVATCGRDAQAYANRLIKVDQSTGNILLETDRGTLYKTILSRGSVEAELASEPGRPLEAEGWLALGFPPSRLLSWDKPKSPEGSVEKRPSPEDLLPLIKGVADPRIDGLKQWLVNLDYWIKDAKGPAEIKRYEDLRSEFFNVIGRIAIGTKIAYVGIENFEVIIETLDGRVPLAAISQGTASLMGWVGVLLQRLYETPLANVSPLDRYALVLIDEIDAHMHPSWQRSLVESLKELFPNVQFIATTHSSLIVAGLKQAEIYAIRRESLGKVIAARPRSDPQGWYPDMVLTSDLFRLESTLPPSMTKAVKRYTELAAKGLSPGKPLSSEERREMVDLAELLNVRQPEPAERQQAREAFDIIRSALDDRLKEIPIEEQRELLAETQVQLQEVFTQSRRP